MPFITALLGVGITDISELPLGAVIATCSLVDCVPITPDSIPPEPERSFGDYSLGRFAWTLEDIKMLPEPVPAVGRLGLWEWKPSEGVV